MPQPLARLRASDSGVSSTSMATHSHPVKSSPIHLWQHICEHHGATHIVDFSPGSGGLSIAAVGALEYEGVATNELHCGWLDSTLDLVVKYLVVKLGGDDESVEKIRQYFGGANVEARRYLEAEGGGIATRDYGESSAEDEE